MSDKVYYFSFYPFSLNDKQLTKKASLAARDKVDYLCDLLIEKNIEVEIISFCPQLNFFNLAKSFFTKSYKKITLSPSFNNKSKLSKFFSIFFLDIILSCYFFFKIEKGALVIFYHCDFKFPILFKVLQFLKTKITLQVEEIYSDLPVSRFFSNRKEEANFFAKFKNFIICSSVLSNFLPADSSFVVIEGPVKPVKKTFYSGPKVCSKNQIQIVYAGTLSYDKGGADIAVQTMDYLPDNYNLKVYGVGDDTDKNRIKELITQLKSPQKVELLDPIPLEKLEEILKNFDVGLATQRMGGAYVESSFPSKIYLYLNNGLKVICPGIKSLKNSNVSSFLSFYEVESFDEISNAIIEATTNENSINYFDYSKNIKDKQIEELYNLVS